MTVEFYQDMGLSAAKPGIAELCPLGHINTIAVEEGKPFMV